MSVACADILLIFFLFYHTNTGVPNVVKLDKLPDEIDSENITLIWKEPEKNGADIEKYTVYKRLVTSQAEESKWEEVATTRVRECIIELERGKTYEFSITATNKCGEGEKENTFQRVTVLESKLVNLSVAAIDYLCLHPILKGFFSTTHNHKQKVEDNWRFCLENFLKVLPNGLQSLRIVLVLVLIR